MNAWLAQHAAALRLALRRLLAAPFNTLLSLCAVGIALALPAGGQMLLGNIVRMLDVTAPNPQITVFMSVGADTRASSSIGDKLRQQSSIKDVQFLPRDATLARMKNSPGLREVIDVLSRNPFPDAFVVTPADNSADAMEALAAELRKWPKVEHVQLDSAWVRRLEALIKLGRGTLAVVGLLLASGLVAITFNIIRLQVLTVRAEIEISRLLGATEAFIRRPFLYYGSILGALGGLLAWLLTLAGGAWLRAPLQELAGLYGFELQFAGPGAIEGIGLALLAGLLGWCGAAWSLRQHAT